MKAVIKWTLWGRRWGVVWWSIGVSGFIFLNMIFYPSFRDDAAELQKTFENLPDAAVQLFGGSTDFFSPVGFVNSQIFFMMLPLLLGILAISLGSNLIAREEQDKTIEMLLARPLSRGRLLLAKGLAGMLTLAVVTAVALFTIIVTAKVVNLEVPLSALVKVIFVCFLLVLSFGAVAFLLTAIGKARSASLGLAAVIALGGYFVSSLAGTVHWLAVPSKFFPFHYYQSETILRGTYDWAHALFFIAVIVACSVIAWICFRRRDLG